MKMVFTKEQYQKVEGDYLAHKGWVDECDGKTVEFFPDQTNAFISFYSVRREWCVPFVEKKPAPAPSALNPLWAGIVTDATTAAEVNAMIDQLRRIRYDKRQKEAPAPEYDEVKRPAYKGDTIKLIEEPSSCFKSKYHKGDTVKIEEYGILPSVRAMDGCSLTGFFQNEYVVLVPRKKEA